AQSEALNHCTRAKALIRAVRRYSPCVGGNGKRTILFEKNGAQATMRRLPTAADACGGFRRVLGHTKHDWRVPVKQSGDAGVRVDPIETCWTTLSRRRFQKGRGPGRPMKIWVMRWPRAKLAMAAATSGPSTTCVSIRRLRAKLMWRSTASRSRPAGPETWTAMQSAWRESGR